LIRRCGGITYPHAADGDQIAPREALLFGLLEAPLGNIAAWVVILIATPVAAASGGCSVDGVL